MANCKHSDSLSMTHSCSQICLQQLELWQAAFTACHCHGKSHKYRVCRGHVWETSLQTEL